jgi:hypothetical protein
MDLGMVASMRGMHMAFGTMDIFVRRIDSIWYITPVSVYVRFVLFFSILSIFSLWVALGRFGSLWVALGRFADNHGILEYPDLLKYRILHV